MTEIANTASDQGFRFSLQGNGLGVEFGKSKFVLSYFEERYAYDTATETVKGLGGQLPTAEQWMTIAEHWSKINDLLEFGGQVPIGSGWYWTRRKDTSGGGSSWVSSPEHKLLGLHPQTREYLTRAVFPFPELETGKIDDAK